ncbi:MAG: sigma-70 family RNA polymerase sigma factor [Tannerella sp.]|jgi:RNA polymerase sigma-70 factor (ECF subfamily)|nr:sigma-70 family RNA polymerase sigma factor [Tannerella sp.]
MEEKQLVKGCVEGERKAQKALYDRYSPQMMSVCLRYMKDKEDARDLLQEGFILVFSNIARFRGESTLGTWVRKIFVNEALNMLRRQDVLQETVDMEDDMFKDVMDETVISQMSAAELMDYVKSLPESFRAIFNLFAVEGYSHREIGEMLGIPENTARSKYMRARLRLQKMILNGM